ncbi:MAG: hypothetical protein FJY29_12725 [Betaproteobacteria bacterium]|nr:hypothetical protein [Betaproteobacteria bacterium]
MTKRTKRRQHISKSSQNEIIVAKVAAAAALALAILIGLSLGTRTSQTNLSPVHRQYEQVSRSTRGWEPDAALQSESAKTDLRAHAGFHFEWPARLNAPQLKSERLQNPERIKNIDTLLKLGRSRAILRATPDTPNKFLLEERLAKNGQVTIHKDVYVLVPGEKISIHFDTLSTLVRQWKLRVRTLAVTQDRRDSTLQAAVGFSSDAATTVDIDPHGNHTDLDIPALTEFTRRGEKNFAIEWPKSASGLLVLEGFQPGVVEAETRAQSPKTLIVYIDKMNAPLTRLTKTLSTINKATGNEDKQNYFSNVIPPAESYHLSRDALITGRTPVELGASLKNEKLRSFLSPQNQLINKMISKGGSARRIQLRAQEKCGEICKQNAITAALNSVFTSELTLLRREEFASTQSYLRSAEFINDPGLLFVEVEFPQEHLRLNWDTISQSESSTTRWITSGLLEFFGKKDQQLKGEEKIGQLDVWLSSLMESFLSSTNPANIALILHDNGSPIQLSAEAEERRVLKRGEALLYLHNAGGSAANEKNAETQKNENPASLQNILRVFEKSAHQALPASEQDSLLKAAQNDEEPIAQIQSQTYTTLTRDGWLIDPKHATNGNNIKYAFRAFPEKIQLVQEQANAEKKKSRLTGLHITLTSSNMRDEIIETELSTSLGAVGCESQTENAKIKELTLKEAPFGTETSMTLIGRRPTQAQWHIFCLFEGRISNSTFMRLRFKLNGQVIEREKIGLSEFALPVRGFLWRSPDTIELVGAQILDATVALGAPDAEAAKPTSVVLWSEKLPSGIDEPRATFLLEQTSTATHLPTQSPASESEERLSEKE